MSFLRRVSMTVLGTALALSMATPAQAAAPRPGSIGAGDPYFPRQGNGGYDVSGYALELRYDPATRRLGGTAQITARATQALSRFDLDLRRSLHASAVRVNGEHATFSQPADLVQELVVTPAHPIARGATVRVEVDYAGTATDVTDPDGSPDGWIPTDDGAFVASEPQGSPSWFPVNDSPTDKASYRVSVTVPKGLTAVSNGALLRHTTTGAWTTWAWRIARPISSYLVTATVGRFTLSTGRTAAGVPYLIAVDPRLVDHTRAVLAKLPAMVDYYTSVYGRYPFGSAGAIVDVAPQVGYALETATRPVFDRAPDELTLAHELAHQWYGDDVTLARWRDIWLNEGFAEFSAWLWDEHRGHESTAQHLIELFKQPATSSVWNPPPADPGDAANLFDNSVYERGAGALAALREKLGDPTFFSIMRGWVREHAYGIATVPQFTAYAERVSGRDLSQFFDVWLYRAAKPSGS